MWRVHKVLQFKRRKVEIKHVIAPILAVQVIAILLLTVWTTATDHGWERIELDETTAESIGSCTVDTAGYYILLSIAILAFFPTLLAGVMAWKTIDVDEIFSESKYTFSMILVQFQVRQCSLSRLAHCACASTVEAMIIT